MNYLPDAWNHGAEIYTHVAVRHLERRNDRWVVHYHLLNSGREKFDAPTMFVTADLVILGAGTLGSTEILLRSQAMGLSVSGRVGHHFTGN
jgi:cholesterol oxidase